MKKHQTPILLAALVALTSCLGGEETALDFISLSARRGVSWSNELMQTGVIKPIPPLRPSALLGPYVAAFLSMPLVNANHAAVSGVIAAEGILHEDNTGIRDESYALLEELGLILQVDLVDHLNRSLDRQMALDTYREGLIDIATRCQDHQTTTLTIREDDADAKVKELRKQQSLIQRNLNNALRDKDYATAGSHQADLSEVQGELAIATADQKEIRNVIRLFKDSLNDAAERLQAIDANRDALIAGVEVTDTPGAQDLGVLQDSPRGTRRADPEDVFGPVQPTE